MLSRFGHGLCSILVAVTMVAGRQADANEPLNLSDEVRDRCLKVLREGLASDEFWPAMHAAEALTIAGHGDEVLAALTDRVPTEKDDQRRCGLARELVRAGDLSMTATMLDILGSKDDYGHVHAAESLFKVFQVGDGRLLRKAAEQDENVKLKLMAAGALVRGGNLQALQLIRQYLSGTNTDGRLIAAWLLTALGDRSDIPQLQKNLSETDDPLTRCYIENALACLGDEQGLAAMERNLRHRDAAVRTYAANFAGDARAVQLAPTLVELLDDNQLDVRIRSAQSLLTLAQPFTDPYEDVSQTVFEADAEHPRYSEGDILVRRDGTLLYAVTEFTGGGQDHATAQIIAKTSADGGRTWSKPFVLQPNVGMFNVMSLSFARLDDVRPGRHTPIGMFYLVKNSFTDLKAYVRISTDQCQTFSHPIPVTSSPGYHVMNNNRVHRLSTGRLVCPVSTTADVQKENHFRCVCWYSDDQGKSWKQGRELVDLPKRGAMEPELVELKDGRLLMAMRNQLGKISVAYSNDQGDTWSEPKQWNVQAPEAPFTIRRVPATGDLLLIWNNNYQPGEGHGGKRTPLTAAISSDEGETWTHQRNLETDANFTYAYTSLAFDRGRVLLSYYVCDEKTGRISNRFRSLPVRWFYEGK